MHWIQKAWIEVSTETIVNCFHRAVFPNSLDYSIETNMEDKDLDTVKKLLLMTGEHHISPGYYEDIDNYTDTTFISQSGNILKEFFTNKEEGEEEYNHEEENITTYEILFDDDYNFKQNLLIMENFILHEESGFMSF